LPDESGGGGAGGGFLIMSPTAWTMDELEATHERLHAEYEMRFKRA